MNEHNHFMKTVADVAAASVSFASLSHWGISEWAAAASFVWMVIRISEWAAEKIRKLFS